MSKQIHEIPVMGDGDNLRPRTDAAPSHALPTVTPPVAPTAYQTAPPPAMPGMPSPQAAVPPVPQQAAPMMPPPVA
ncbi:MAG: hypothetical protein ABIT21_10835, partial [Terrimesophilobacter sp.]